MYVLDDFFPSLFGDWANVSLTDEKEQNKTKEILEYGGGVDKLFLES